jgi:hypothetical protein
MIGFITVVINIWKTILLFFKHKQKYLWKMWIWKFKKNKGSIWFYEENIIGLHTKCNLLKKCCCNLKEELFVCICTYGSLLTQMKVQM